MHSWLQNISNTELRDLNIDGRPSVFLTNGRHSVIQERLVLTTVSCSDSSQSEAGALTGENWGGLVWVTIVRHFGSKSSALGAGPHCPALTPYTEYKLRASSPGPPTISHRTELAWEWKWDWNSPDGNF